MLSGATWSAAAIVGTAVLRIVVSNDSIKNATAISHGTRRLLEAASGGSEEGASIALGGLTFVGLGCIGLRDRVHKSAFREKTIIADSSPDFVEAWWTVLHRRSEGTHTAMKAEVTAARGLSRVSESANAGRAFSLRGLCVWRQRLPGWH
jgi:hypothetical protein